MIQRMFVIGAGFCRSQACVLLTLLAYVGLLTSFGCLLLQYPNLVPMHSIMNGAAQQPSQMDANIAAAAAQQQQQQQAAAAVAAATATQGSPAAATVNPLAFWHQQQAAQMKAAQQQVGGAPDPAAPPS